MKEYTNKNGRKVYDGGGVKPDITSEQEMISRIAASLYLKNFIFDYANLYVHNNPSPVDPDDFSLSEQEYAEFIKFLDGKDFDYQTETEDNLRELIETAQRERYYELATEEFKALRERLVHDKDKDLQVFRGDIIRLLNDEIIGRHYFQSGRVRHSLKLDQDVQQAMNFLKDPVKYASILQEDAVK
jgi:carboxyl-terminal processing protease